MSLRQLIDGSGFRVWDRTRILVEGDDAATVLHNFCTNGIEKLSLNSGCEAFFLNVKGKIVGFANVIRRQQDFVIETVAGQYDNLVNHLDRYVISEDVKFSNLAETETQLLLVGKTLLSELVDDVPAMQLTQTEIGPISASYMGLPLIESCGGLCLAKETDAGAIVTAMQQVGATELSAEDVELIRIASGYPEFGSDITADNLPQEVDRNQRAIDFNKGCYLGQETVARIDAMGHVNWLLVGFQTEATRTELASDLLHDEKVVGRITSTAERSEGTIGLAMVRREVSQAGTTLQCAGNSVQVRDIPLGP